MGFCLTLPIPKKTKLLMIWGAQKLINLCFLQLSFLMALFGSEDQLKDAEE